MKAWLNRRYGSPDVLEWVDVPAPVPAAGEVLVRVRAVSINDWDWALLKSDTLFDRLMNGLTEPKHTILGSDIAGTVESIGAGVTDFSPGDEVYGDVSSRWGGFAEQVSVPSRMLRRKPASMTFEQAAAIPQAGMLALQALRDTGRLSSGQRILINGAGGGVGTLGIQIARTLGAAWIAAVDSASKLPALRSLGADEVIDYRTHDFTRLGERYDLIVDTKSSRGAFDLSRALVRGGSYVTVGGSLRRLPAILAMSPLLRLTRRQQFRIVVLAPNADLDYFGSMFDAGKVIPVIDPGFSHLEQLPDALRYFGRGEHVGKIVLTVPE